MEIFFSVLVNMSTVAYKNYIVKQFDFIIEIGF